jgi:hypothetical protein
MVSRVTRRMRQRYHACVNAARSRLVDGDGLLIFVPPKGRRGIAETLRTLRRRARLTVVQPVMFLESPCEPVELVGRSRLGGMARRDTGEQKKQTQNEKPHGLRRLRQ